LLILAKVLKSGCDFIHWDKHDETALREFFLPVQRSDAADDDGGFRFGTECDPDSTTDLSP
jgi:hypothetical protein